MQSEEQMREFEDMLARGVNSMHAYFEHFAPEDIGFGEDYQHDRNALRAALSSLPRMTEEELVDLLTQQETVDGRRLSRELSQHIARALIAKLPHLLKE